MQTRAVRHLLGLAIGVAAAWALQSVTVAVGAVSWLNGRDFFQTYTPYFPGLDKLATHRIFSASSATRRKIVLLGASTVDSIGCDYTWHKPPKDTAPNVHWSCSVAGQLNELLQAQGHGEWEAFDLARTGAKLTEMLYVYAQVAALKPDVVVYGESFNYYMWDNADADGLDGSQYGTMDDVYGEDPRTHDLWLAYQATLRDHGWVRRPDTGAQPFAADEAVAARSRASASFGDVLARGLLLLRQASWNGGMPRPIAYTGYRDWSEPPTVHNRFDNPDPGFGYFQGIRLIDQKQREFGGKTFLYFSPQWNPSYDLGYIAGLDREFGGYLRDHGIPFANLVGLRMKPVTETYDGSHHTRLGNRRIAVALLQNLQKDGLVPP